MDIQSLTTATSLFNAGIRCRSMCKCQVAICLNSLVYIEYFGAVTGHALLINVAISGDPEFRYRSIDHGIAAPITMGRALQCDAAPQGEV